VNTTRLNLLGLFEFDKLFLEVVLNMIIILLEAATIPSPVLPLPDLSPALIVNGLTLSPNVDPPFVSSFSFLEDGIIHRY
jgi:hypothetical protein